MRSFSYILFLSLICNFAYGQAIIKGKRLRDATIVLQTRVFSFVIKKR